MISIIRILLLLLVTTITYSQEPSNTIALKIQGIDNEKGQMLIGLYNSLETWLEKPAKGMFGKITDDTCEVVFSDIPDGIYAISVFHDEDNDGELDTNFIGIPSEDTGSSNDAPARFGPPKWEDAKFKVHGGTVKQVINL